MARIPTEYSSSDYGLSRFMGRRISSHTGDTFSDSRCYSRNALSHQAYWDMVAEIDAAKQKWKDQIEYLDKCFDNGDDLKLLKERYDIKPKE